MTPRRGFSYSTVQNAALKMRMGVKPEYDFSDKFSMEDIDRLWRKASMKVFNSRKKSRIP